MNPVNSTFFLSLSVIILGYLMKKANLLTEDVGRAFAKTIFTLTLPAVIIRTGTTIQLSLANLSMLLLNLGYGLFIGLISYFILKRHPPSEKGLMLMTVLGFNIGNFAYPIIQGIWGLEGLQYIAMFDVGNAFIIFALSYGFAAVNAPNGAETEGPSKTRKIVKKILTSIPLLTYIGALAFNLLGFTLPGFIDDFLAIVANANSALSLLTMGIFLKFTFKKSQWGVILRVLAIRYSFGLVVGFLLYFFLPFEPLMRLIALVAVILPIGLAQITYAVEFGYDEELTGTLSNITMMISFGLIWTLIIILS